MMWVQFGLPSMDTWNRVNIFSHHGNNRKSTRACRSQKSGWRWLMLVANSSVNLEHSVLSQIVRICSISPVIMRKSTGDVHIGLIDRPPFGSIKGIQINVYRGCGWIGCQQNLHTNSGTPEVVGFRVTIVPQMAGDFGLWHLQLAIAGFSGGEIRESSIPGSKISPNWVKSWFSTESIHSLGGKG